MLRNLTNTTYQSIDAATGGVLKHFAIFTGKRVSF